MGRTMGILLKVCCPIEANFGKGSEFEQVVSSSCSPALPLVWLIDDISTHEVFQRYYHDNEHAGPGFKMRFIFSPHCLHLFQTIWFSWSSYQPFLCIMSGTMYVLKYPVICMSPLLGR